MPIDSALILRAAADIDSGDSPETTTAIEVEGGSIADVVLTWTGKSGTSPTLDVELEVSVDGGSTYEDLIKFRQFDENDVPTSPRTRFVVRRPVWIPQNTQSDAWAGSLRRTLVRIRSTIGGSSTPTFTAFEAYLDQFAGGSNRGYEQL